jgi:putative endonuclease
MYYVYVLQNKKDSLYIGFTTNLKKRLTGHKSGDTKTTKGKDYVLIYYEAYRNKADALGREKFLKGGSGRKYLNKQLKHYLEKH